MKTETIEIVDRGRGPQLSTSRITVLDIFYWLHRGYDWDQVHESMPSLSREEFDVVADFIKKHHDELVEMDHRAEEYQEQRIAEQYARGFGPPDEKMTDEEWVARFREKIRRQTAETNGEGHPG